MKPTVNEGEKKNVQVTEIQCLKTSTSTYTLLKTTGEVVKLTLLWGKKAAPVSKTFNNQMLPDRKPSSDRMSPNKWKLGQLLQQQKQKNPNFPGNGTGRYS